jgi:predicted AAA+ superfamily ATPase
MIDRTIGDRIHQHLGDRKALILKGARQVGKTTLLRRLLSDRRVLWVNGDKTMDRALWDTIDPDRLQFMLDGFEYVVIDEAQRIANIGLTTKLIIDEGYGVQPILSGSSSLNLASTLNEPLTGRKWSFELFPISWTELRTHYGNYAALQQLEQRLLLGSYPEVVTAQTEVVTRLEEIASSYLYKDILDYGLVRKPELIDRLLRALAYQVGSEVSFNELANMLQVSYDTIRRYVQLLEESYVIFRLDPLSTNPRKEISTSRKIYFIDNGIRNAIINNFDPLHLRNDQGALWENYIVSEFLKQQRHSGQRTRLYYWRSRGGAEVDLMVQEGGRYRAYEIKYNPKKRPRFPQTFIDRYAPEVAEVVNSENFWRFLA